MKKRVPARSKFPKAGSEKTVIDEYGKRTFWRNYRYPDGKIRQFLLWGADVPPVIIFALDEIGDVIVIESFCPAANRFIIELPGGCIDKGQSPEDAVRVELRQETGYVPKDIGPLVGHAGIWFEPHNLVNRYIPFIATGCRKVGKPKLEATELIKVRKMPPKQLLRMIEEGKVCDSKTIAITHIALRELGFLYYV